MIMNKLDRKRDRLTPKQCTLMLLLLCSALIVLPTHSLGFQFNPALQPFLPHKKDSAPRYPAPDFTLNDLHGKSVNLSDYQGSVVAMMFWTTW